MKKQWVLGEKIIVAIFLLRVREKRKAEAVFLRMNRDEVRSRSLKRLRFVCRACSLFLFLRFWLLSLKHVDPKRQNYQKAGVTCRKRERQLKTVVAILFHEGYLHLGRQGSRCGWTGCYHCPSYWPDHPNNPKCCAVMETKWERLVDWKSRWYLPDKPVVSVTSQWFMVLYGCRRLYAYQYHHTWRLSRKRGWGLGSVTQLNLIIKIFSEFLKLLATKRQQLFLYSWFVFAFLLWRRFHIWAYGSLPDPFSNSPQQQKEKEHIFDFFESLWKLGCKIGGSECIMVRTTLDLEVSHGESAV